jgi:hypothetical protein
MSIDLSPEVMLAKSGVRDVTVKLLGHAVAKNSGAAGIARNGKSCGEYPLEALGNVLGPAAKAIAAKVQCAPAMAAQSVMAAASLAAQAIADVRLPYGQVRPVSLYIVTVARSGDRKSTSDNEAMMPVRMREAQLRDAYGMARAAQTDRKKEVFLDRGETSRSGATGVGAPRAIAPGSDNFRVDSRGPC